MKLDDLFDPKNPNRFSLKRVPEFLDTHLTTPEEYDPDLAATIINGLGKAVVKDRHRCDGTPQCPTCLDLGLYQALHSTLAAIEIYRRHNEAQITSAVDCLDEDLRNLTKEDDK